jgi:hypothetical protein
MNSYYKVGPEFSIWPLKITYYRYTQTTDGFVDVSYLGFKKTIKCAKLPGGSFSSFATQLIDWLKLMLAKETEPRESNEI